MTSLYVSIDEVCELLEEPPQTRAKGRSRWIRAGGVHAANWSLVATNKKKAYFGEPYNTMPTAVVAARTKRR